MKATPDEARGTVCEKGRVLLLEDDPVFSGIIRDCLTENGYTVVAVQNGGEGVREVLGGDFTLVLCDIMMPGLPGDMFYRAIERIRPALCQRFVFMTGHQNDPTTNEFIKNVNGLILQKPFPMQRLLDSLAFAEVRTSFQSVFEGAKTGLDVSSGPGFTNYIHPGVPLLTQAAAVTKILARARTTLSPGESSDALQEIDAEPREGVLSRMLAIAAISLPIALVALLWPAHFRAQARLDAASSECVAMEREWTKLAPGLESALATRSKTALVHGELARLSAESARPRWAPVMRCIVPPRDSKVEILGVDARCETKDLGACELRVHGIAGGEMPRQMADHFRQSVEESLKKNANGRPVSTHFEAMHDVPGALPDERRTDFVMIATVGSLELSLVARKEGR